MKAKRIIPIFIILILSLFPTLPFVDSAGYGEENENLGQFTDDFENADNVSVAVNVINNQTLDCMELNYTLGIDLIENFTDYTEVDTGNNRVVVISDNQVAHLGTRNEDTYLYYDYGVDYFGNFTHDLSFESAFDNLFGLGHIWVLSNIVNDVKGISDTADEKCLNVRLYSHGTLGNIMKVFYHSGGGAEGDTEVWDGPLSNTIYYMRIIKNGVNVYFGIYSTEILRDLGDGTDGDVHNLSLILASNHKFRYIFAVNTWNDGSPNFMNYDVYNLSIGRKTSGYNTDGYFITEDYLNYTTGQGLALLTNASIPGGTSITVQFSNDNATWVDNEGNIGSNTLLDEFYAIDLRDLNYTASFKRYNLTTTDTTITPRLFQSRLVTTNGTAGVGPVGPGPTVIQNVTGEWIYYNLTTINVIVGTHDSGDLNSTLDVDADTFDVSETVGAPAWLISFNWTNVDQDASCLWVVIYSFYDGNLAHDIDLQLYNFTGTSWTTISLMPDMTDYEWINASIYDLRIPNDYVNSSGAVLGRIIHNDNGNINHDIQIEFLKLHAFVPSEVTAPTITEDNFFWVFIAIVLSIIVGLLMWLKDEHNNN